MNDEDDPVERAKAAIPAEMIRFTRPFWYVATGLMLWGAFWAAAERHQHIPHAQTLSWTCVLVALYIVYNY